jgi:hypothetical protein
VDDAEDMADCALALSASSRPINVVRSVEKVLLKSSVLDLKSGQP